MLFKCVFCGSMLLPGKTHCTKCGRITVNASTGGEIAEDAFVDMSQVDAASVARIKTGGTWDLVWGGGFVPTTTTLLAGNPGSGKTTLLMQLAVTFSSLSGKPAYYIASEQAAGELRFTLDRLGAPFQPGQLLVLKDKSKGARIGEDVFKRNPPGVLILDSLTDFCGLKDQDGQSALCNLYREHAKKFGCPAFIITQMNKQGDTAGLNKIQHDVDTIVELEPLNDPREFNKIAREWDVDVEGDLRVIIAHKNRYGATGVEYPLAMTATGLVGLERLTGAKSIEGRKTGHAVTDVILERARLVDELNGAMQDAKDIRKEIAELDAKAEKQALKAVRLVPPPEKKPLPKPPAPRKPTKPTKPAPASIEYNGQKLVKRPKTSDRAKAIEGEALKKKRAPMPKTKKQTKAKTKKKKAA